MEMEIEMTNQYEFDLVNELKEELGDALCKADWDEFWEELNDADRLAKVAALDMTGWGKGAASEYDIDVASEKIATYARRTRADLPSLIKYIWTQIEIELRELGA